MVQFLPSGRKRPCRLPFGTRHQPQRRRPFPRGCSNRTLSASLPPAVIEPSKAVIAARASWPSISTKPKPLQLPVKISCTRSTERTVPKDSNISRRVASLVSEGKLPMNNLLMMVSCQIEKTPPMGGVFW